MGEVLTTVRRTTTKETPAWARTADGIVRRWEGRSDGCQTLMTLRLTDRLQRLFVVGCCRLVRLEGEDTDRHGGDLVREALGVAEGLADAGRPDGRLLDTAATLYARFLDRMDAANTIVSHACARLVLIGPRTRTLLRLMDGALAPLLAGVAGRHVQMNGGKTARRSS